MTLSSKHMQQVNPGLVHPVRLHRRALRASLLVLLVSTSQRDKKKLGLFQSHSSSEQVLIMTSKSK